MTNEREEDSGLHDIRSLASSAKERIARRSTMSPVVGEDDVLASSSAGWKAVALPEPAKMVSLPELAALPNRTEIEALDREARAKVKAEAKAAKAETSAAAASSTATAVDAAVPVTETPAASTGVGGQAATQPGGRGKMIAIAGVGIAAAAGLAIVFATRGGDDGQGSQPAAEPVAALTAQEAPPPPPVPEPEPAPAEPAEPEVVAAAEPEPEPAPVEDVKPAAKAESKDKDRDKAKVHKVEIRDTPKETKQVVKASAPAKEEPKKSDGEPSFDELLREAGVTEQKKEVKPKLDKKSLSGADIKKGMGAVASKAQACYQGTQGMAQVRLTVDPSGKVEKVTVSGAFAGTPVASCVEAAVKSATFPPWDGGPQSFSYSYLLAE